MLSMGSNDVFAMIIRQELRIHASPIYAFANAPVGSHLPGVRQGVLTAVAATGSRQVAHR